MLLLQETKNGRMGKAVEGEKKMRRDADRKKKLFEKLPLKRSTTPSSLGTSSDSLTYLFKYIYCQSGFVRLEEGRGGSDKSKTYNESEPADNC